MRRFLTKLKPNLREPIIIYGSSLIIMILSIIFFSIIGYPLVSTADKILPIQSPPIYMISIFFPYGILLGEVLWLWNEKCEIISYLLLSIESMIIAIFSFIRYIVRIPYSGHMIILSFYLLHQIINNHFQYPSRFFFGIAVLIITVIYKILFWNDPFTLILGTLLGAVLWLPGFLYRQKKLRNKHINFNL